MFHDRFDAGEKLTENLKAYKGNKRTVVVGIPRGGVVVASVVAARLSLPLFVVTVVKLRAPLNPELAIGAIAPLSVCVLDRRRIRDISSSYVKDEINVRKELLSQKSKLFQNRRTDTLLSEADIYILVDDGVATGFTVLAALSYIRKRTKSAKPAVILAVPVIAQEAYNALQSKVDAIITVEVPDSFVWVGQFYRSFPQVRDEEVSKLLAFSY